MDFNFINDTTQVAYFQLGLGTFDVNYGTIDFSGTLSGGDSPEVIATIAPGATVTGVDITEAISAKLLLSLGTTLVSDDPSFTNPSLPDYDTRWDKAELSLFPASDTVDSSVLNLSAADFFGLDLEVQTFASATATVAAQTLGWNVDAEQALQSLAAISNYNTNAVMTGPNGVPVTLPRGGTIDVLRVVAPASVAAAAPPDTYPSFNAYIQSIQNSGVVTTVADKYLGNPSGGTTEPFKAQAYDFAAKINPSSGSILPGTGFGDLVLVGTAALITGIETIDISAADLAAGIYGANPPFTVNGTADTIGNNDVYAAAVAEILGGFDSGFVGSGEINPNTPGTTYADSSTGSWYNPKPQTLPDQPQPGNSYAFAAAQPTDPNYYDNYAATVVQDSNVYGSPFTDLIGTPQAEINPTTNSALGQSVDHVDITILPDSIPCFATGTPIMTDAGEVPVERLTVGARLPTRLGRRLAEVVWIGQRSVDCRRHPRPQSVWPVRVKRGAFGRDTPRCDVLLSRDHALLADDVLIPVRYLINGTTIVQEPVDQIGYWHIELDRHDVILAAGLPAESFLDTGNRSAFSNGGPVIDVHPEFAPWIWEAEGCAPLVVVGEKLERVRAMLRARACRHGAAPVARRRLSARVVR
jgi:hypothetical protein